VPLAKALTEDELEALTSAGVKLAQMRANGEPLVKDPETPRVFTLTFRVVASMSGRI
jgi:hypothetical protein